MTDGRRRQRRVAALAVVPAAVAVLGTSVAWASSTSSLPATGPVPQAAPPTPDVDAVLVASAATSSHAVTDEELRTLALQVAQAQGRVDALEHVAATRAAEAQARAEAQAAAEAAARAAAAAQAASPSRPRSGAGPASGGTSTARRSTVAGGSAGAPAAPAAAPAPAPAPAPVPAPAPPPVVHVTTGASG